MFEEIKAKLGLDITNFERGIAGAQGSLSEVAKSTTKKLTDMKGAGQALATALGINLQSIADGIARFVVGFSKEQEEALNDLVSATDRAAAAQEAITKKAAQDREKIDKDIADKEETRRKSKLTDEQRLAELSKRSGQIMTERAALEKQGMQTSSIYARLKNEQLDIENEISEIEKKGFNESDKRREDIANAQKKLNKTQRENALDEADDATKLKMLREDVLDAEKAVTNAGQDQVAVLEAQNELEEKRKRLRDEIARQAAGMSSADKKNTDDLAKDLADLADKAAKLKKDLEKAKRQTEKPTMAEVASGERDIGAAGKFAVKQLPKEEKTIRRLQDRESRLQDQFAAAKSESDKKTILEEGRRNRKLLDEARARADKLRASIEGKVSDVPFADQEAAAKEAADAAKKAQAEAAKNATGQPAPTKPSAAEAAKNAVTAAQGAVEGATGSMTKTTTPATSGADWQQNLQNCATALGDIKTALQSTSITTS